jgi:hypothetical protein
MLTPGSDFVDLAAALQQSCATLAAAATAGFTSADCNSVGAATIATGLTAWTGPSEPRDVTMSPVRRSVRVAWRAPASHGSSPVTSYAVHVRPPIGEDDFFPIEATSRRYQLPDLSPGVDYTIGLVAVTADGTSPSVVRRFAGTALQVRWPESVPYATRSVLRGSLTGAGRTPAAGRVVRLLERQDGRPTRYRPVASTTTAADGTFALRLTQRRGETLQVSYAGSAGELGALSRTHRVSVRVRVGLVADFPRAGTAGVARFTGSVTPAVAGSPVRLQRRLGAGPWRTAARDRLATNGRYRLAGRTTPGRAETWRVVVVPRAGERFGGSGRLVGGSSRVVAPPS